MIKDHLPDTLPEYLLIHSQKERVAFLKFCCKRFLPLFRVDFPLQKLVSFGLNLGTTCSQDLLNGLCRHLILAHFFFAHLHGRTTAFRELADSASSAFSFETNVVLVLFISSPRVFPTNVVRLFNSNNSSIRLLVGTTARTLSSSSNRSNSKVYAT